MNARDGRLNRVVHSNLPGPKSVAMPELLRSLQSGPEAAAVPPSAAAIAAGGVRREGGGRTPARQLMPGRSSPSGVETELAANDAPLRAPQQGPGARERRGEGGLPTVVRHRSSTAVIVAEPVEAASKMAPPKPSTRFDRKQTGLAAGQTTVDECIEAETKAVDLFSEHDGLADENLLRGMCINKEKKNPCATSSSSSATCSTTTNLADDCENAVEAAKKSKRGAAKAEARARTRRSATHMLLLRLRVSKWCVTCILHIFI